MIRVSCLSCQKKLSLNDSLAGKSVKCPACKEPLRVPGSSDGEAHAVKPAPAAATVTRQRRPEPTDEGVAHGPPRRAPRPVADIDAEDDDGPDNDAGERAPPKRGRKKDRKKRRKNSALGSGLTFLLITLVSAAAIYVLLTGLALFAKAGADALMVVGCILIVVGKLWLVYIARQEDTMVYLMVRFVPFYSLYYCITRFHEAYKPFLTGAAGALFLVTGLLTGLVHGNFRERNPMGGLRADLPPVQNLNPAQRERLAADILKAGDKLEARAWLAGKAGRGALEFEPAESAQHVNTLYTLGAKQVLVANIDAEDPTDEHAQRLVVVLPENANQRRAVFEFVRQTLGNDEQDTGQKNLVLD